MVSLHECFSEILSDAVVRDDLLHLYLPFLYNFREDT